MVGLDKDNVSATASSFEKAAVKTDETKKKNVEKLSSDGDEVSGSRKDDTLSASAEAASELLDLSTDEDIKVLR